jgi:hypothetical protein
MSRSNMPNVGYRLILLKGLGSWKAMMLGGIQTEFKVFLLSGFTASRSQAFRCYSGDRPDLLSSTYIDLPKVLPGKSCNIMIRIPVYNVFEYLHRFPGV